MSVTTYTLNISAGQTVNIWLLDANGNITAAPMGGQLFTVSTSFNAAVTTPNIDIIAGDATASTAITSSIPATYQVTVTPGAGPLSAAPVQTCLITFEPENFSIDTTCVNGATRPYYRDAIRRKMGFTPPADLRPSAQVGDAPPGENWPSNVLINEAISDAIRKINAKAQIYVQTSISIPVTATTNNGVQFFPLAGVGGQSNQNSVNAILRCVFVPASSPSYSVRLFPQDFRQFDRANSYGGNSGAYGGFGNGGADWIDNAAPSTPQSFIVEGYQIGILPPSAQNGTLEVWANTCIPNFCSDTDLLPEIPVDYSSIIEDLAVVYCNMTNLTREESANQVKFYGARAQDSMADLIRWKSTQNQLMQPNLIFQSSFRRMRFV